MSKIGQHLGVILMAILGAMTLRMLVARRISLWGLGLLLLAPITLLLTQPAWFYFSYHGAMHASITYQIFERGLPPEHPLLAGTRLGYPHGHHMLIAWLMEFLPLSPPFFFQATNLLCLPAAVVALDRIARQFSDDLVFRRYAVVLALINLAPFSLGPLARLAATLGLGLPSEHRLIPLYKFLTINSNQLGITLFLFALGALVSLLAGTDRPRRTLASLAAVLVIVGVVYPLAWMFTAVLVGVLAITEFLVRERKTAVQLGLVLVLSTTLLIPVIVYFSSGRATGSLPTFSLAEVERNFYILLFFLPAPAVLLWARSATLWTAICRNRRPARALFLSLIIAGVFFLLLSYPDHGQYKFFLMGSLVLGILLAFPLHDLHRDQSLVAVAVLVLALIPLSSFIANVHAGWQVNYAVWSDGRRLRHTDPLHDTLYRWITEHTSSDAVIVDTLLTAPVLSRRSLFVACGDLATQDARRSGWAKSARFVSLVALGGDPVVFDRRCQIVQSLLASQDPAPDQDLIERLRREIGPRPCYIIARDQGLIKRLGQAPQMQTVFQNTVAAVFQIKDDKE